MLKLELTSSWIDPTPALSLSTSLRFAQDQFTEGEVLECTSHPSMESCCARLTQDAWLIDIKSFRQNRGKKEFNRCTNAHSS